MTTAATKMIRVQAGEYTFGPYAVRKSAIGGHATGQYGWEWKATLDGAFVCYADNLKRMAATLVAKDAPALDPFDPAGWSHYDISRANLWRAQQGTWTPGWPRR